MSGGGGSRPKNKNKNKNAWKRVYFLNFKAS